VTTPLGLGDKEDKSIVLLDWEKEMALKFANEMADNKWQMSLTMCVRTHLELQCNLHHQGSL
jgi:hypothetical protein